MELGSVSWHVLENMKKKLTHNNNKVICAGSISCCCSPGLTEASACSLENMLAIGVVLGSVFQVWVVTLGGTASLTHIGHNIAAISQQK